MESVIFPGEEDEEVIFRADCKLWKLAPWRKSIVMSTQCGPAQYPLPGQGMSWRRAQVRGAGEGDEQKLFLFLLKGSSLQEANHWHKLARDTGQVHTWFFFELNKVQDAGTYWGTPFANSSRNCFTYHVLQGWRWQERGCGIVGALLSPEHLQWCLASPRIASLLNYDKFFPRYGIFKFLW